MSISSASIDKYNIKTITNIDVIVLPNEVQNDSSDIIKDDKFKEYYELLNYFWFKNELIITKIIDYFKIDQSKLIIDVGGGTVCPFPYSTHIIDIKEDKFKNIYNVDIDFDFFPFTFKKFYFSFCRHTLEDIQNPTHAFNEIIRISQRGVFETPSPLAEFNKTNGEQIGRGYIHHRYIVWSDKETNTLFFLPKYPIIDRLFVSDILQKKMNYILNNYPVYWNNYYLWDEDNIPKVVIYRNEINFEVIKDYPGLVFKAIEKSFEYTNYFIEKISSN